MTERKIEDFMNRITIFQPAALSAEGTKLSYISNVTGVPQVWLGDLDSKTSKMLFPKPITTDKKKSPNILLSLCFL